MEVEVVLVGETEGGDGAEEDVPDSPAANGGDEAQDNNAQKIHPALNAGEGARCCESGCTKEIEEVEDTHKNILACSPLRGKACSSVPSERFGVSGYRGVGEKPQT